MLLLLAGDIVGTSCWKIFLPANVDRTPIEESERGEEEVVVSAPRQRTRCRLATCPSVPQLPPLTSLPPATRTALEAGFSIRTSAAATFPLRC